MGRVGSKAGAGTGRAWGRAALVAGLLTATASGCSLPGAAPTASSGSASVSSAVTSAPAPDGTAVTSAPAPDGSASTGSAATTDQAGQPTDSTMDGATDGSTAAGSGAATVGRSRTGRSSVTGPSAATAPADPAAAAGSSAARTPTLKPGSRGTQVLALQNRLKTLGYWVSASNGSYGHTTAQAVMAYQKVAGLTRDGVAGPKTLAALVAGTRPTARSRTGRVMEIDKARQVIKLVNNGRVELILNTSTGNGRPYRSETGATHIASTPAGSFRVSRQIRGWHKAPLGRLYSPKFFNGGIAVHGSDSIPGYPASHGCARVSVAAMDHLWSSGALPIGARVLVY